MKTFSVLLLIFINTVSFTLCAESAHLAVAANFRQCMQELVRELEEESDHSYVLSFGSSGRFYGQILNGAPFDLFFSADVVKPQAIDKAGFGVSDSRFTYAIGSLVLLGDFDKHTPSVERALKNTTLNRLSIANPKLAPYGIAAVEVLQKLGLEQLLKSKWVIGENIAQAYQFVESGNAAFGFVALSQVIHHRKHSEEFMLIPDNWHQPIMQQAILLKRAQNNNAAHALIKFMKSTRGQQILTSHGYLTNENDLM